MQFVLFNTSLRDVSHKLFALLLVKLYWPGGNEWTFRGLRVDLCEQQAIKYIYKRMQKYAL